MPKQSKRSKAFSAARKTFKAASALLIVGHLFDSDVAIDVDDPDPINYVREHFVPSFRYRRRNSISSSDDGDASI